MNEFGNWPSEKPPSEAAANCAIPDGLLHYFLLMRLALQRAKTAREAVIVMGELVDEYGYGSTGESFSISDTEEAWIMEMIGPGPGGKGANWLALRIPDGYVCAHANMSRIGEFQTNIQKLSPLTGCRILRHKKRLLRSGIGCGL